MRNNKGFTLVELLGVLVLLAVIGIITVPTVNRLIKNSKEKSSLIQEQQIMNAAKSWSSNNLDSLPKKGMILVTIQTLIDESYIDAKNIDEIGDSTYSTMCVKIKSNINYNTYDYVVTDCSDNIN